MLKKLFFLSLLTASIASFSQTKEEALRDAKITSKATVDSDFNTVLRHTYPSIVKMMGGKEKALETINTIFTGMQVEGIFIEKITVISASEIVKEQGEFRCFVESFNEMKTPEMEIKSKSYLLGIYNEDLKIWYFLEAERLKNKRLMDQILPNFKTSLKIPNDEKKMEKL